MCARLAPLAGRFFVLESASCGNLKPVTPSGCPAEQGSSFKVSGENHHISHHTTPTVLGQSTALLSLWAVPLPEGQWGVRGQLNQGIAALLVFANHSGQTWHMSLSGSSCKSSLWFAMSLPLPPGREDGPDEGSLVSLGPRAKMTWFRSTANHSGREA